MKLEKMDKLKDSAGYIPFFALLNAATGSTPATLMMTALEHVFSNGMPSNALRLKSDPTGAMNGELSLMDRLWFQDAEFTDGWTSLVNEWSSEAEFLAAPDRYKGKFYAAYQDEGTGRTVIVRNNEVVNPLMKIMAACYPDDASYIGQA